MKKNQPNFDLYAEALSILRRSEVLKKTVYWQDEQVEKLTKKYSDDEFEALSWEEKEKHLHACEEIMGRLEQSVKELRTLDDLYNGLRQEYIKRGLGNMLPPVNGDIPGIIGPNDEVSLI